MQVIVDGEWICATKDHTVLCVGTVAGSVNTVPSRLAGASTVEGLRNARRLGSCFAHIVSGSVIISAVARCVSD